jgi:hypothetical protein
VTHEYGDSINADVVETAVVTTLRLRRAAPDVPLKVHVDRAIHLSFCACVIDDEDVVEGPQTATHAAMIDEVTRRVEQLLGSPALKPVKS